ncbi:recombinase family protein [Bradyrhizobium genosp. SA-3]|uniref:recombinase family protein n=1 Tax=Bradyrhizobium genosp. SA-3 TaxID=508868 RepID=UPI003D9AF94A
MRVSPDSDRQNTDLQRDALLAAGVDPRHLFEDHASGAKDDRTGLARALEFVRPGDMLVVWKLDRVLMMGSLRSPPTCTHRRSSSRR